MARIGHFRLTADDSGVEIASAQAKLSRHRGNRVPPACATLDARENLGNCVRRQDWLRQLGAARYDQRDLAKDALLQPPRQLTKRPPQHLLVRLGQLAA